VRESGELPTSCAEKERGRKAMSNEEIQIAVALGAWKSNLERADRFFTSLDRTALQQQVAPGRNRAIYLWGHLTATHDRMLGLLGLGDRVHPEFDAVFLSSPDGASELPTADELRTWWDEVNKRLREGLTRLAPSDWLMKHTAVSEEDFAKDLLRNRLAILLTRTNHLAYHLGQTALLPR
jgi:hypothetical protein